MFDSYEAGYSEEWGYTLTFYFEDGDQMRLAMKIMEMAKKQFGDDFKIGTSGLKDVGKEIG
jgi:hypothetical protein